MLSTQFERQTYYGLIKVYRYLCFTSTLKGGRDKLQVRASPRLFLGYPFGKKGLQVVQLRDMSSGNFKKCGGLFLIIIKKLNRKFLLLNTLQFLYLEDNPHVQSVPDTIVVEPSLRRYTQDQTPTTYLTYYVCNSISISSHVCCHTLTLLFPFMSINFPPLFT
ncbi:hypothetical protein V2J09_016098 [Rumex salicifolius]